MGRMCEATTILHWLGLDHDRLTDRYADRNFRLTMFTVGS